MAERDELKDEILAFLAERPGATTTAVRKGVSGSASRIAAALEELEDAGEIENGGNGRGNAWRVSERDANGFLLSPEEVGASYPREIAGVAVRGWTPPQRTALALGTTTRTLARWGRRGLPSRGDGRAKLFPWPHCLCWASEFRLKTRRSRGDEPTTLELSVALARDHAFRAEQGWPGLYGALEESGAPE